MLPTSVFAGLQIWAQEGARSDIWETTLVDFPGVRFATAEGCGGSKMHRGAKENDITVQKNGRMVPKSGRVV